ncbi:hypothetical protein BLNAU_10168 [Blattamonas nauphoetae]|uniref:Uncharacterized protein n=1 Tax=Blattamonas nauphoetae TaxID=2049346 RepID=A0ABQ9XTM6_9EUKA|nr:hypothetical protein BLNAU_10168 [Blattamonas nauphoetae]
MVTDGYKFDEELVNKVSTFLSSVDRTFGRSYNLANDLLKSIAQDSPNAAEVVKPPCHSHLQTLFQNHSDISSQKSLFG